MPNIEAVEFARARAEVASTGRPDWVARVELVRCAGAGGRAGRGALCGL